MRVALGTFARSGIEARLGVDLAAGVQVALRHYAHRLKLGWRPVEFPRFRREYPLEATGVDFELSVEPEVRRALEREARKFAAPVELLMAHAVFVYLADLDEASEQERMLGTPQMH